METILKKGEGMKKSLLLFLSMFVSNIGAYSYFADNTTPYKVQIKLTYGKECNPQATKNDKLMTIPANTVGYRIEDTKCCVDSVRVWRVDPQAPTNITPEDVVPSKRCQTTTFVIYANPNYTVSVID